MILFFKVLPAFSRGGTRSLKRVCALTRFQNICSASPSKRWGSTINIDTSLEHGLLIPNINIEDVGVSSHIGRRKYQEDRLSVRTLKDGSLYLGIFDGHGGSLAAEYAMKNMPTVLEAVLETKPGSMIDAFEKAFVEVNRKLLEYVRKRNETERYAGTTATVCIIKDNLHLHTANVGDSRAVLCRKGEAVALTNDHSPEREDERVRVEKQGGIIVSNSLGEPLVNGRLAMTRSIGDFDLKPYGVTAVPEYSYKKLKHGSDTFLTLITDGVTFSMTNQEAVNIILSTSTPQSAADEVTETSLQLGSQDNTTAVVLPFGYWGRYEPISNNIRHEFGRSLSPRD